MIFPCFSNRVKGEQKFSMSSQTGDGEGGLKTILSAAATPREEHLKIGHYTKKGIKLKPSSRCDSHFSPPLCHHPLTNSDTCSIKVESARGLFDFQIPNLQNSNLSLIFSSLFCAFCCPGLTS